MARLTTAEFEKLGLDKFVKKQGRQKTLLGYTKDINVLPVKKPGKYGNKKVVIDGIRFDSIKEGERYSKLKLLVYSGKISELKTQEKIYIIINEKKIGFYKCDFTYLDYSGQKIVEDVKSISTSKNMYYRLKKKLIAALYGIEIKEV